MSGNASKNANAPHAVMVGVLARVQQALAWLPQTRVVILRHYSAAGTAADVKSDASPVTIADRACEELLRGLIATAFPGDAVLGEEFGQQQPAAGAVASGFRWLVDPIDGTRAYCRGVPLFGTLIGVECQGACVGGICDCPALGETVWAWTGGGCWHQQGQSPGDVPRREGAARSRVSVRAGRAGSICGFTAAQGFAERGRAEVLGGLMQRFEDLRGWSDCYGYVLLATGRLEAMVDPAMKPWDVAALVPIVREAGGVISAWGGEAESATSAMTDCIAGSEWGYEQAAGVVRGDGTQPAT